MEDKRLQLAGDVRDVAQEQEARHSLSGGEMIMQQEPKLRILVATEDGQTLFEGLVSFDMAGRLISFLGQQLCPSIPTKPAHPMLARRVRR